MDEQVIANAQHAANTPASGPPPAAPPAATTPVQERRQQPPPTHEQLKAAAAARFEANQKERADAAVKAAAERERVAAEKLSPAEQRVKKANANPALWDPKAEGHDAARQELRAALAAGDSQEERQRLVEGGVKSAREVFTLDAPMDILTLGKEAAENYDQNFSDHEAALLRHARAEGWDRSLASDLRDHGVRLGLEISERGTSMTADEVAQFKAKFKGRLTEAQQTQLLTWFRQNVVGG
jgi:hypothetical protein